MTIFAMIKKRRINYLHQNRITIKIFSRSKFESNCPALFLYFEIGVKTVLSCSFLDASASL